MKRVIVVLLAFTVAILAEFKSLSANELEKMIKQGVPIIDIRLPMEWQQTGIIEGAHLMTFFDELGRVNAPEWMYNLGRIVKSKKEPFIIYCAHANRTKILGEWLSKEIGFEKVYELKGGIEYGWIPLKKPTVKPKL